MTDAAAPLVAIMPPKFFGAAMSGEFNIPVNTNAMQSSMNRIENDDVRILVPVFNRVGNRAIIACKRPMQSKEPVILTP
jgi:hypothetical protein